MIKMIKLEFGEWKATHLVYDDDECSFFFVCIDCINPKTDRSLSYDEIKKKFEG